MELFLFKKSSPCYNIFMSCKISWAVIKKNVGIFLPNFLAWVVPLFFYITALSPSIQLEDAGELTAAALTFGIPHPSGYPIYNVLAKMFALTFGNDAWAINLFSAVMGSVAAYFIFKIVKLLKGYDILAVAAAWLFAFYPSIWSQALIAEVYTLHAAFIAAAFYLLLLFILNKNKNYFYSACLITGLGIANHLMMIWFGFLIIGTLIYYRHDFHISEWVKSLFCGLLGLSFYIYLPLAALSDTAMNWGNPSTWHNFWQHVLRLGYQDMSLTKDLGERWALVAGMVRQWLDGLGWPVILGLIIGLGVLIIKKYWWPVVIIGSLIFMQTVPVFILRGVGWNLANDYIYSFYWSGAMVGVVILFGLGTSELYNYLLVREFISQDKIIKYLLALALFLAMPWAVWYEDYAFTNYHNDNLPYSYAKELLTNLPPHTVLYIGGRGMDRDSLLFTISYVQIVEQVRPDVLIIDGATIYKIPDELKVRELPKNETASELVISAETSSLEAVLKYAAFKNLTPYTLFLTPVVNSQVALKPDGYAYRIFASVAEAQKTKTTPQLMPPAAWSVFRLTNYSGRGYLSHLLYFQAAALEVLGRPKLGQQILLQAIDYDNQPFSDEYNGFVGQRQSFK